MGFISVVLKTLSCALKCAPSIFVACWGWLSKINYVLGNKTLWHLFSQTLNSPFSHHLGVKHIWNRYILSWSCACAWSDARFSLSLAWLQFSPEYSLMCSWFRRSFSWVSRRTVSWQFKASTMCACLAKMVINYCVLHQYTTASLCRVPPIQFSYSGVKKGVSPFLASRTIYLQENQL